MWRLALVGAAGACAFHRGAAPSDAAGSGSPDATDAAVIAPACPPLPDPGATVSVADVTALYNAVASAAPGSVIELADGTYDVSGSGVLLIDTDGITLRSLSHDASKVILDGGNASDPIIGVHASNVTLTELTIAHAGARGVIVSPNTVPGGVTGDQIYDVTFTSNRGAAISIYPFNGDITSGSYADDGVVACSRIVDEPSGADCNQPTIGLQAWAIRGWTIRNNYFEHVNCDGGYSRNIWINYGSRDVDIIANTIINSDMNIQLGDAPQTVRQYSDPVPPDCAAATPVMWGGLVCDNVIDGLGIPSISGNTDFDHGIALWTACDTWVMHNTVVSPGGGETFGDIEFRFAGSYVHLANNLLEQPTFLRDSATQDPAWSASNQTYAATTDFMNAAGNDLHLASGAPEIAAPSIAGLGKCTTDADGKPRNLAAPTPGAYER